MLTLTNNFHNTKTTVRMLDADLTRLVMAVTFDNDDQARKRLLRIKRRLCPVNGCACSGPTGER